MVKVKICCISSVEEARLAVAYGAAAIGLVGRMPSALVLSQMNLYMLLLKRFRRLFKLFY